MSKFNELLQKVGAQYLLTEAELNPDQSAIPDVQQDPAATPATPAPEQGAQEPQKLTVEGKRYLIEVALKALSLDPNTLSEQDKTIFNEEVTAENADTILQRLQSIIDSNSPANAQ